MTFTATFEFETRFGQHRATHEARVTYTIERGRPQTYGQPAETQRVAPDMDFEICLSGTWLKASDDLHDVLLEVLGDDLEWLIENAREQAMEYLLEAAE